MNKKRIIPFLEGDKTSALIVLRQEQKYLLNPREFSKGISIFSQVLHQDENNGPDGYTVRTLYFDSLEDRDYHDKVDGLENRKKIRLRIYNIDDPVAKLEVKRKQGIYQAKQSLVVSRQDALEFCRGEYQALLSYDDPFAVECYAMLQANIYRPKVIVEYKRFAFIGQGSNKVRLTFDHDIRSTEVCFDIYSKDLIMLPVSQEYTSILEVKYDGFIYTYMKELLDSINKSQKAFSKYCISRQLFKETRG